MKYNWLLFFVIVICAFAASGQDSAALRKKQLNQDEGVAMKGYDPFAYFKQSKALRGKKNLQVFAEEATYYLSCSAYKEEFKRSLEI